MFWSKKEKTLGQIGEDIAAKYLKKKGYKIIERNFKNKIGRQVGEIDIVAEKNKELVFVEVKTRIVRTGENILPEENITPSKLHKLAKAGNNYIKAKKLLSKPYHFDAVSVLYDSAEKKAQVRHLENIFI